MKHMRVFLAIFIFPFLLNAQQAHNFWKVIGDQSTTLPEKIAMPDIMPQQYITAEIHLDGMLNYLAKAPDYNTNKKGLFVQIPMPDGHMHTFEVWEQSVMEPALAAKYSDIKTYRGTDTEGKYTSIYLDISSYGFHASIRSSNGTIYISPFDIGQAKYYYSYDINSYDKSGLPQFTCGVGDALSSLNDHLHDHIPTSAKGRTAGTVTVREYRLALGCTGEYGNTKGGTIPAVMATFVTATNRLNQIFEAEVAIRFVLIDNTDDLIWTNAASDPYPQGNLGGNILDINNNVFNANIAGNSYDIGHVFTNSCTMGLAGIAYPGTVCVNGQKASGVTCHYNSSVPFMVVQTMSHEVGHQFSAMHSWNHCPGNQGQFSSGNAFEPGGGSTIMSYQSCSYSNITNINDDYFNTSSIEDIHFFSRIGNGSNCPIEIPTDNNEPELELPYTDGFSIPIETPFELTAIATDADGDELYYCWEQSNRPGTFTAIHPDSVVGNAPIFRSFLPVH